MSLESRSSWRHFNSCFLCLSLLLNGCREMSRWTSMTRSARFVEDDRWLDGLMNGSIDGWTHCMTVWLTKNWSSSESEFNAGSNKFASNDWWRTLVSIDCWLSTPAKTNYDCNPKQSSANDSFIYLRKVYQNDYGMRACCYYESWSD